MICWLSNTTLSWQLDLLDCSGLNYDRWAGILHACSRLKFREPLVILTLNIWVDRLSFTGPYSYDFESTVWLKIICVRCRSIVLWLYYTKYNRRRQFIYSGLNYNRWAGILHAPSRLKLLEVLVISTLNIWVDGMSFTGPYSYDFELTVWLKIIWVRCRSIDSIDSGTFLIHIHSGTSLWAGTFW